MTAVTAYRIELPAFNGPLDLLLHLIDRNELDITAISLAKVTEQYLQQIEQLKKDRIENLIDFLVIAARLMVIKSRALLPQTPTLADDEEEEDPAEALIRQLKLYKQFKQAANRLKKREESGLRTYLRVAPPPKLEGRLDLTGITINTLAQLYQAALARQDDLEESVAIIQPRRITIEGQIGRLRRRLQYKRPFMFHEILSNKVDRVEISVTLLAMLELMKRHELTAVQPVMFGPIELRPFSETPPDQPLNHAAAAPNEQ